MREFNIDEIDHRCLYSVKRLYYHVFPSQQNLDMSNILFFFINKPHMPKVGGQFAS